jgi:hypothetical protein
MNRPGTLCCGPAAGFTSPTGRPGLEPAGVPAADQEEESVKKKNTKWVVWVGLALMLLAMFGYVMSMDESDPDMVPRAMESMEKP